MDRATRVALAAPHVDSFDYFLGDGLRNLVAALEPQEIAADTENGTPCIRIWFDSVAVGRPLRSEQGSLDVQPTFPAESRGRGTSYRGQLHAVVCKQVGDAEPERFSKMLGLLPIMTSSKRCNLRGMRRAELVQHDEESSEVGGYFICNGNERAIRLLIAPKRNHLMGIVRQSFKNRGPNFTQFAVSIRCVRRDGTSQTIAIHLMHSGSAKLRVTISKQEFFVPVAIVLKALVQSSDHLIYQRAIGGDYSDSYLSDRLITVLRDHPSSGMPLHSRIQCLAYLGSRFRPVMRAPAHLADVQVGELFLNRYILVHISMNDVHAKWELLLVMLQKTFALASGRIKEDNPDSLVNQEVLLPGHLFAMIFKESLGNYLGFVKRLLEREVNGVSLVAERTTFGDGKSFRACLDKASSKLDIGRKLEYFLATGNLISESGLDLQQNSGFTIVAERLNFWRFISHFRSIHRGAFFAQLRTTTVRKLLPDSWGFLCPVHTPDGSPCGLLNHLSSSCHIAQLSPDRNEVISAVASTLALAGAVLLPSGGSLPSAQYLPILLDSQLLGRVHVNTAASVAIAIRNLKVLRAQGDKKPLDVAISSLEIALVMPGSDGRFPGLFMYCSCARFLRPVWNLKLQVEEQIGPLEQTTLRIACSEQKLQSGVSTHVELSQISLLSVVASLTPFCDFNQSPRNMYQCQMGKQTMGTPYHSFPHRTDTKTYRIQTPQTPIVRNTAYSKYQFDEYATGTNAVVAVVSYTGYDMEDAMIINKSSFERGFGHASMYTTTIVDLNELRRRGEPLCHSFGNRDGAGNDGGDGVFEPRLGTDGLPAVGMKVTKGDPLCVIVDESTGRHTVRRHKSSEAAVVEEVHLLAGDSANASCEKALIKLRFNRNPVPGDKFSSRHGQKGVMSRLWPTEDMPFNESGLVPDILFNPHGFPSRMTIGMLLESMAGKAGALHATQQDGTPFRFSEQNRAVDFFGEELRAAGYTYHGTECMYSGTYGSEIEVQIFIGIVYYQRLRHMVSDKDQVRAKGPINQLTHQPIHGRKVHGGIRLGEMERDALLAHGTAFLIQERLLHCSDESRTLLCSRCGSLLTPMVQSAPYGHSTPRQVPLVNCRRCASSSDVDVITLPYVFHYLTTELAGMNIKTSVAVGAVA